MIEKNLTSFKKFKSATFYALVTFLVCSRIREYMKVFCKIMSRISIYMVNMFSQDERPTKFLRGQFSINGSVFLSSSFSMPTIPFSVSTNCVSMKPIFQAYLSKSVCTFFISCFNGCLNFRRKSLVQNWGELFHSRSNRTRVRTKLCSFNSEGLNLVSFKTKMTSNYRHSNLSLAHLGAA